jgi:hypothetical protein
MSKIQKGAFKLATLMLKYNSLTENYVLSMQNTIATAILDLSSIKIFSFVSPNNSCLLWRLGIVDFSGLFQKTEEKIVLVLNFITWAGVIGLKLEKSLDLFGTYKKN